MPPEFGQAITQFLAPNITRQGDFKKFTIDFKFSENILKSMSMDPKTQKSTSTYFKQSKIDF